MTIGEQQNREQIVSFSKQNSLAGQYTGRSGNLICLVAFESNTKWISSGAARSRCQTTKNVNTAAHAPGRTQFCLWIAK